MVAARGRYANGAATREQILSAAIDLFAEVGYHGASLRAIAARAGSTHPGLLYYFPTKADLVREVLRWRDEEDRRLLHEDIKAGKSFFEATIGVVERNSARRSLVELFLALAVEATSPMHPAHTFFVQRYTGVLRALTEEFEKYQARGQLAVGVNPSGAARTVVALMDGLQIQWLLLADDLPAQAVDMADDLRQYLATLFDGTA